MIPKECKRLAEVDFPIAVVSKHAAREKFASQGHPSTLHLWWARRPLAACRSMLLALLLPDPCDENCPEEFKRHIRELLVAPIVSRKIGPTDLDLRQGLLEFIGDFANWDLASDRTYLDVSRQFVRAAHGEDPPIVVDPFGGGGSIPLEASRLGCDTFASDLNPVSCLILKTVLEDIPRDRSALADELSRVGAQIKIAAETDLAEFYPADKTGEKPIAYLWARTVRCETPNCGAEIPLIRSFWLSKKPMRRRALKYRINAEKALCATDGEGAAPTGAPQVEFEVVEPKNEQEIPRGTVSRAKATCLCCQIVMSPDRVRAQLSAQHGGSDTVFNERGARVSGARLMAVVTVRSGVHGKHYRLPTERDYEAVWKASQRIKDIAPTETREALALIPDESTPAGGGSGAGRAFSVQKYGMMTFGDLFASRQLLALTTFLKLVAAQSGSDMALNRLLACAFSRVAMSDMSCTRWNAVAEKMQHTFGRQALPIVWDFAEVVPIADAPGNWRSGYELIVDVLNAWPPSSVIGQAQIADAMESPLVSGNAGIWFTDPPYYDAVPYADLSDFFFVWLKRILVGNSLMRDPFDSANRLTPKTREVVQDEVKLFAGQPKDRAFFERAMRDAFAEGRRVLADDGIGCVVFAHKTTEGWEALLSGMIQGGWIITGSWPIATEMATRLRARESAALATSIHLICRPRTENQTGDWEKVLRQLPNRVGVWMERLQAEGVRGADLVFACIGPALEIYSQYARVVDAEEREIPLGGDPEAKEAYKRGYLAYVWEVVGRTALEQILGTAEAMARNGAAGALEEDARLTALFLWTLQSTNGNEPQINATGSDEEGETNDDEDDDGPNSKKKKGFTLIYDVARRFAQPLGIHLEDWEDRIVETKKGVVRLVPVSERGKQLFGEDGVQTIATELERGSKESLQMTLYADLKETETPKVRGRRGRGKASDQSSDRKMQTRWQPTTLDRVHAAMLLQASGRANALRALLESEQERGPDFLRLANALSALYPKDAEEKRLLDAMLLAVPR